MPWDKEKQKQYLKEYNQKNKDILKEKARARYLKNVDIFRENARKYHAEHKEEHKKYHTEYYRKNNDIIKAKIYKYRKENSQKIKEQGVRYRKKVGREILNKRWVEWKRRAISEGRYHVIEAKRKYKRTKSGAFCSYRKNAKKRNIIFELDKNTFFSLLEKQCVYCGGDSVHGVDRIHNHIGYTKNNSVPCCWFCNRAKSSISFDKWCRWIERIKNFDSEIIKNNKIIK